MWNKKNRIYYVSIALFIFILTLRGLARLFPSAFLSLYTNRINKWMIQFLSHLFNFFRLSIFELLVYSLIFGLIWQLVRGGKQGILRVGASLVIIYSVFMMMWGLNYDRPSVADDFGLKVEALSDHQLKELYLELVGLANDARKDVVEENGVFVGSGDEYDIQSGYDELFRVYGVFGGGYGRWKPVMSTRLLSGARIAGIYGAFTGEPNVNGEIPAVARLFTIAHEAAHQRGVAHEDQTNFVAFLACVMHPDPDFRYSGYFNALKYVREALHEASQDLWLREHDHLLDAGFIRDFNHLSVFWEARETWLDDLFSHTNDLFMNFHNSGEYVAVVDFLYAYFTKDA